MGCMTDLSTDEAIMGSQVVAATESDHKDVLLKLVQEEDVVAQKEVMGDGSVKLYLKPSDQPYRLDLQLLTPSLRDVQFVVETTEGASMEHGQCDKAKRVAGRGKDILTLLLMGTESPVSVWAGWATSQEAVRLTPVLEFHLEAVNQLEMDHEKKEQAKEKLEEQLENYKEDLEKVVEKDNNKKKMEKDRPSERARRENPMHNHHQHHKNKKEGHSSGSNSQAGDDVTGEVSSRSSRQRKAQSNSRRGHHRHPNVKERSNAKKRSLTQKIKDHLAKHKKDRGDSPEPGIDLDTTWFVYGLGVLLVGNFLVVQGCKVAARKGSGKSHSV